MADVASTPTPPDSRSAPRGVENVAMVHTDRARAHATFERLGFTLTPQGAYLLGGDGGVPVGLANHHALFPDGGYWEIITIDPEAGTDLGYAALIERHGTHLGKVTLRLDDATAEIDRLVSLGVEAAGPIPIRRSVESTGGVVDIDMELVAYPAAWDTWLHSSLTHADRDLNYIPEYLHHPNGVRSITGVVVSSDDLDRTGERLEQYTGAPSASIDDDHRTVTLPDHTRFELWSTAAADREFPVTWSSSPESLRAVIFGVESLDATEEYLITRGATTRTVASGLSVEAEGVHLVFERATSSGGRSSRN